jgi:hypothetical protein
MHGRIGESVVNVSTCADVMYNVIYNRDYKKRGLG